MKKFLSVLVILFSPVIAFSQGVSATGVGTVFAKPDCAHLSFSITTTNAKAKQANADNKIASDSFFALLKKHKIDDKNVSTQHFNISPVHEETKPGHHKITGYSVSHQISVRVHDMKLAGVIIDEAVEGNVHLNSISFMVSNRAKLENQARNLALMDAHKKAKQMVTKLGSSLGALKSVGEAGYYPSNPYAAESRSSQAPANTTIATGQMAISVRVTATWDIEDWQAPPLQMPLKLNQDESKDYFDKLKAGGFKDYPNSNKGKLVYPAQHGWHLSNCVGFAVLQKNEFHGRHNDKGKGDWAFDWMGSVKFNNKPKMANFDKLFTNAKAFPPAGLTLLQSHGSIDETKLGGKTLMIAIYGHQDKDGLHEIRHFARKEKGKFDDMWVSKLGTKILVQHEKLMQFEAGFGRQYGDVVAIYGK